MALKDIGARFVVQGEGQFINSMGRADAAMDRVGNRAQTMGTEMRLGLTAIAAGATAVVAGLGAAVSVANAFESSFAGVRKTVQGTPAELETLRRAFIDMSLAIPVTANEINRIGEAAGQLGIKKENLLDFTRVAAEMGIATNLSSDQAAEGMARLANIVQLPQEQFRNLGSTIVDLGNNSAATESEILQMGLRLAGAGTIIGLTTPQILGFATALTSVGIEAESGGTAFSRVFVEIANSVKSGGEQLDLFAAVAGQTTASFKKQFETDAAGAIVAFVKGLDNVNKTGGNVFETLEALELGEIRVRDALLRSAQAGELMSESTARGTQAWSDNIALTDEANRRYETTESKLILAANAATELTRKLGEELQPATREAADALIILINDALIPLVNTYGPALGGFLTSSAQGWRIWAGAITSEAIPAMDKWMGTAQGLLNLAARLPGPLGFGAQAIAGLTEAFTGNTESVEQSGHRILEEIQVLRELQAETALQTERDAEMGIVLVGTGEAAEIAGVQIAGWGGAVAAAGGSAGAANPRIADLTRSLLDGTDSSKGAAAASKAEAEARRLAAEAARAEAEALREAKEARDAIVASITANVLRGQASVQLGSSANPRMEDFDLAVAALAKITAAGGDTSIAIALLDRTLAEFSGVLSTLGGDDLAESGAVMEGLTRLREEYDAGRIGAEEYAAGLQGLTGELGGFVTKALDAAEKLKEAQEETFKQIEQALRNHEETIARNAESLDKQLTEAAAARRERMEADAKREIELAQMVHDAKLGLEIREANRQNALKQVRSDIEQRMRDAVTAFGAAGFDYRSEVGADGIAALIAISEKYQTSIGDLTNRLEREGIKFAVDPGSVHIPTEAEKFGRSLVPMPVGAGAGAGSGSSTSFVVNANYSDPQQPQSIRLDLEALLMAAGR